jgi:predicted transposase YbfD/YdcC
VVKGSGNAIVVQVKDNQKQLLDDCRITAQNESPVECFSAPAEKARNRIEYRECRVFVCLYTTDSEWNGLIHHIIEVKRRTETFNTKTKLWQETSETAFYISTTQRSAEEYNAIIRNHWSIENRQHHVRDTTMREDYSRVRKNPAILARMRSFALNILRANNVKNIAQALYENALSFHNTKKLKGILC